MKTMSDDERARYSEEVLEQARINMRIWAAGERKAGFKEGLKEGLKKGFNENVARKMLAAGYEIDIIARITELEAEEIEALKNRES